MGYRLPIVDYVANDYQKRVIHTKQNHIYIDHPYKVILRPQEEQLKKAFPPKGKAANKKRKLYIPDHQRRKKDAAMTGKGLFLDRCV
ncbi:MAG TPA: hypothetical protein VIG73_11765 [Cerasibacillus sp.]|uniref:hypothetical protein n=1 Tax=Cerasibacillus sp. TaxID=2498711 RepID=UPI002F42D6B9